MRVRAQRLLLAVFLALFAAGTAAAQVLRVGTSGDYAPFSVRGPGKPPEWTGLDVSLARAYARDRGLSVEFVPFDWPTLLRDLAAGRFDVAMSGITVRPERSAVGTFTSAWVETAAVAIARQPDRWQDLDSLDRPPVRIAVNAGGHLEQLAAARFPKAVRIAIADNAAVREALVKGSVDAVVTDELEAREWMRGVETWRVMGRFSRDRKAPLVRADRPDLAADLDDWLIEREADGTLARLRSQAGVRGGAAGRVATPLAALFAAMDERLSLMPTLGAAKRAEGFPLEVPARERLVIDAALRSVEAEAARRGVDPPPPDAVRAVFRALIQASKQVQWTAVRAAPDAPEKAFPDVDGVLRPALMRIGDRVARRLVSLPRGLAPASIQAAARDGLRTPQLSPGSLAAIASAVSDLSNAAP